MEPIQKSVMCWQYSNCRENTVEDWVRTLSLGQIDCFRVKSHDGMDLMGKFYSHPLAPVSLDEIQRQYEAFGERGVTLVPWCNPLGRDVPAEAKLAIAVARRCGDRIDVDLETGRGFWDVPVVGNARIPEYFQRIKDAGIDIILDTAMFEGWVEALRLVEVAPLIRRLLSQSYWVGFGKPWKTVIDHDVAEMRRTGAAEIGIVGDVRALPGEFATAAAYAQSLGCVEFSGWAADFATPASYEGYRRIPAKPFIEETPPPLDRWFEMHAAASRLLDITEPGVSTLPNGEDISDEHAVLAEVGRILQIVDRHRAALAGE